MREIEGVGAHQREQGPRSLDIRENNVGCEIAADQDIQSGIQICLSGGIVQIAGIGSRAGRGIGSRRRYAAGSSRDERQSCDRWRRGHESNCCNCRFEREFHGAPFLLPGRHASPTRRLVIDEVTSYATNDERSLTELKLSHLPDDIHLRRWIFRYASGPDQPSVTRKAPQSQRQVPRHSCRLLRVAIQP